MSTQRPVHLDLTKMKFPRMAIVSILHRVSGVLLFLLLPFQFYLLHESLESRQRFLDLKTTLANPFVRFWVWVTLVAVLFHLIAGVRHLIMDLGFAESLRGGKISATIVLLLAFVIAVLAGVWLW